MSDTLLEALTDPRAYPHLDDDPSAPRIEVIETHISILFFAGDRVYKTKKAVDLGFLDYTDLERREHFCHEEVRLGSRLSPTIYYGVAPIRRDADGRLRVHGEGELVEWAVEMRRLPAERMLSAMIERGEIDNDLLEELAHLLVEFHGGARTGPGVDEHGTPAAVSENCEENWRALRPWIRFAEEDRSADGLVSSALFRFLEERCRRFLADHVELLEERVRAGRVREGHGDLHAGNLCVTEERIEAYDPIEFNRRFRCADVAADLAFLAMDLDHAGFAAFGAYLVRRYAVLAGDPEVEELTPFYKGYRAVVRAKVAALRSEGDEILPAQRAALHDEARGYLHLAAAYELPPGLVLMCGLSGTGKSWVAGRLQRPLHALLHRSDVVRRRVAPEGEERYGEEAKRDTYRELLEIAEAGLESGRSVIVDATFDRAERRAAFLELAARLEVPVWVVLVEAPEELVRQRLEARAAEGGDASEADYEVYLEQRESFQAPDEVPAGHVVRVQSSDEACEVPAARLLEHWVTLL